jgi:hypothetical protein
LEVKFVDPYESAQRSGQFKFWNADWDDVDLVGLTCCHLEAQTQRCRGSACGNVVAESMWRKSNRFATGSQVPFAASREASKLAPQKDQHALGRVWRRPIV